MGGVKARLEYLVAHGGDVTGVASRFRGPRQAARGIPAGGPRRGRRKTVKGQDGPDGDHGRARVAVGRRGRPGAGGDPRSGAAGVAEAGGLKIVMMDHLQLMSSTTGY